MKPKIILLSFLFFISLISCVFSPTIKGNGNMTEQERFPENFDKIKATGGINVYISQGDAIKIVVKADKNLLDVIKTDVNNDMLIIRSNANIRHAKSKAVFVTLPDLKMLKASAGSNIFGESEIHANKLEINSSAGSNVKMKVKADKIITSASAGANIYLTGSTEELYAKASAGSNIKAEDLKTNSSELKVSSGANIWTFTSQSLTAKAGSGGNIFYAGEPPVTNINKSLGGNVIKR